MSMDMVQKKTGRCLCAVLGLAAFTVGCAGTDFARLAPPGIIRYEKIAEKKEPNPTIIERISDRREETQARFPKIGETAAGGAKMRPIPKRGVGGLIETLENERDNLDMAVETDALETAASMDEAAAIKQTSDELSAAIEDEKAAAARERSEISQETDIDEK